MKPLFLSVEGCDGSGKSTAIEYMSEYLESKGRPVTVLRAMGTGILGEQVRKCLFQNQLTDVCAATACGLAILNAYDHAYTFLKQGISVIMDRGVPTYYAYNVKANQEPGSEIILDQLLNSHILIPRKPDKTFLIDVEPELAIERIQSRSGELTHLDQKPLDYFQTIAQSLEDFFKQNRHYNGWVIDNRKDIAHMQRQLTSVLNTLL